MERRKLILASAARLFRRHGHAKTGIAEIAREAGIAVGSVYLEFPSKEALVEQLSTGLHTRVLEEMRAACAKHTTFTTRFEALFTARVDTFLVVAAEGKHACELVHCPKTETIQLAHDRYRNDERAILIELLAEAKGAGELDSAFDPSNAAALVQLALAGLSPPALFRIDPTDAREQSRMLAKLVLHGLSKRRR